MKKRTSILKIYLLHLITMTIASQYLNCPQFFLFIFAHLWYTVSKYLRGEHMIPYSIDDMRHIITPTHDIKSVSVFGSYSKATPRQRVI